MNELQLPVLAVLLASIGGGLGIYTAAVALGFRHGIDWDHIAAITDITSATASAQDDDEAWLVGEPGVEFVDERHHEQHGPHDGHTHEHDAPEHIHDGESSHAAVGVSRDAAGGGTTVAERHEVLAFLPKQHRRAMLQGTLYALGHGLVVTVLGVLAIVAAEVLPSWIDGVMERVVGVTLLLLSAYLFFSLYQYFRGKGEFRIRSRWMLVFAGMANASNWIRSRTGHHEHVHVRPTDYTARTAFAIGMIHGVGAETGTQALIIATAVGATSKGVAIAALFCFVVGLLVSNSFVTLASTTSFVSASKRRLVYVVTGIVAATFSLIVGVFFLTQSTGVLPELDKYFRWIGGGTT